MKIKYLIILFLAVLITSCSQQPVRKNIKPIASFTSLHTTAQQNSKIAFDASESNDPDGKIISYRWDFGDNKTAFGASPMHSFDKSGCYLVSLKVEDDKHATNSISKTITVTAVMPNKSPIANFSASDLKAEVGEELFFDASGSYGLDGEITNYYWDFGDKSQETGIKLSHVYARAGSFKLSLTVIDDNGNSNSSTKTIKSTPAMA